MAPETERPRRSSPNQANGAAIRAVPPPVKHLAGTLVSLIALAACAPEEPTTPTSEATAPDREPDPLASVTESDLTFSFHGERAAARRIGEHDLVFRLRNDRMESVRYLRSDETRGGPSFLVEIREGEATREESPWWCGQGLEFVELAPGETVEVLVPAHLMQGDGLRALVHLYGPKNDRKPLLTARSPEVSAWQ